MLNLFHLLIVNWQLSFWLESSNLIYNLEKDKRLFKRKSGEGDIVDGVHKGVTVNYHFSLTELKEWVW